MKRIKALTIMLAGSAMLASSMVPASAMPVSAGPISAGSFVQQGVTAPAQVENVQWRPGDGGPGYYRGYRGSRDFHPGYRRHSDGLWYPLAAFAAGALIGGAIASEPRREPPPPAYRSGINPRHYQWCEERYRTYDAYSNTFVTYDGSRVQCYSPYY